MLYDSLHSIAERYADRTALRHNGAELSYEQLWLQSSRQAAVLASLGIEPGSRVGILAANSIEAVIAQWAIYKCEAISVYINEQLKPENLLHIIEDADLALILYRSADGKIKLPDRIVCPVLDIGELARLGEQTAEQWDEKRGEAQSLETSRECLTGNPERIASIVYTSGSTGVAKGVCLSHGNLVSVARMAAVGYRTVPEDSYLMVVPLHYIHGLMILLAMHLSGASIEFCGSFVFPAMVTRKLEKSGVSGFSGVPYHFSALIDRGGFLAADLPKLRWIGVTGGTITPDRLKQIRQAKPDLEIHISYGQTECSPRITLLDPARIDNKPESVGSVAEGLTVEFLDEGGQSVAPGEIGELVVSGPNVMKGYWNDQENTRRVIDERGRLLTGDLAYMDDEGDIFIKGRKQAMIKSAGERIFPEELEALLNKHPDVEEVAVVGIPDSLYGQRVEAHLVLCELDNAQHSAADPLKGIQDFCLAHVPYARAPRQYHLWRSFPLKANGKIDKQRLIEDAGRRST